MSDHALFEMELIDREEEEGEFYELDDYNEEYGCYEGGVSFWSQVSSVKKSEISDEEMSRLMDEAEEWLRICAKPYEICLEELLATTTRVE